MIGLITVNFNQYKLTTDFLDSLASVDDAKNISVFIADVSTNKEVLNIDKKYPMNVIVKSFPNFGYAYGINKGIKYFIEKGFDKWRYRG